LRIDIIQNYPGKFMKTKYFIAALLLSMLSMGAYAAGSPMNENFTNLIALSNNALESGKQGDSQAFIDKTNTTLAALKIQEEKGSSIRLQRASAKIKTALKSAKAGDLQAGIAGVQQGIDIMEVDKNSTKYN
jgi:hypothetical protein